MFKLVCVRILQKRQDFRMYKLYRLWNLQIADETYIIRNIPEDLARGNLD